MPDPQSEKKWFELSPGQTLVAVNSAIFVLVAILLSTPFQQGLEERAADNWMEVRHDLLGKTIDPNLALIGVDDASRDPKYSDFADTRNGSGWRSRFLWALQLRIFFESIHPRVVAYDYLFEGQTGESLNKSWSPELLELFDKLELGKLARRQIEMPDIENAGYAEMQSLFSDMETPQIVLACLFPEMSNERETWNRKEALEKAFARVAGEIEGTVPQCLPEGSVLGNGGEIRKSHVLRLPSSILLDSPVFVGSIDVARERDGAVRKVPLVSGLISPKDPSRVIYLPSLALQSLLLFWEMPVDQLKPPDEGIPCVRVVPGEYLEIRSEKIYRRVPIDHQGRLFLHPRFKISEMPTASFVDVNHYGVLPKINNDQSSPEEKQLSEERLEKLKQTLNGKIALVAEMGTAALDIGNFALESNVPAGLAHLFAMDNILRQDYVAPVPYSVSVLWLLGLGALATCIYTLKQPRLSQALSVGLFVLFVAAVIAAFEYGWILPVISPTAMLLAMFASGYYLQYTEAAAQRQLVREHFSQMVDSSLLEMIEKNAKEALAPHRREVTVMFSDLANFTAISESLPANELSDLLNRYLSPMTDIIKQYKGFVDKFNGDGIMANWSVPLEDPDHAINACRAAIAQQERVVSLADEIRQELNIEIYVRMGLNSGIVSVGPMGSIQKRQYTVMGDTVNLAARLEPANKDYKTRIIIAQHTYDLAKDKIVARLLDKIVVKGKTEPVAIYELLDTPPSGSPIAIPSWVPVYEEGYRLHVDRQWEKARAAFCECIRLRGHDNPSLVMLDRIEHYIVEPPPDSWAGEHIRKAKD